MPDRSLKIPTSPVSESSGAIVLAEPMAISLAPSIFVLSNQLKSSFDKTSKTTNQVEQKIFYKSTIFKYATASHS